MLHASTTEKHSMSQTPIVSALRLEKCIDQTYPLSTSGESFATSCPFASKNRQALPDYTTPSMYDQATLFLVRSTPRLLIIGSIGRVSALVHMQEPCSLAWASAPWSMASVSKHSSPVTLSKCSFGPLTPMMSFDFQSTSCTWARPSLHVLTTVPYGLIRFCSTHHQLPPSTSKARAGRHCAIRG